MLGFHWVPFAICTFVMFSLSSASGAETRRDAVDVRDDKGNVLIAADRIVSYEWPTHTLKLAAGERAKLAAALTKTGKLVSGVPFTICLGGKPVYSGNFSTAVSSFSFPTPVILVDAVAIDAKLGDDKLQIARGYPSSEFFRGEDPRYDGRLYDALRAGGKLAKANREHTQWIADSLREMQTVKRGMTRADLLRVFSEEGGVSTRTERRYAYRDCPFIKST